MTAPFYLKEHLGNKNLSNIQMMALQNRDKDYVIPMLR
jgi:hypothetical protein